MNNVEWLLTSSEPWTRYRTLREIVGSWDCDPQLQSARVEMLEHPQVQALLEQAGSWPGYALTRHNDARHPLYSLSTLADFGLKAGDPGMDGIIENLMSHVSAQGAFQSLVNIPVAFGGNGLDQWTWVACDAPTLLYALLEFGLAEDGRVRRAVEHLLSLGGETGWGCAAAPELGRFRGPGRRGDPCPIANLYALKALAGLPEFHSHPAIQAGLEMLLRHWDAPRGQKYYLFGVGSDFRKLKYPFVWYDILHVADTLSRYPAVHADLRFQGMLGEITRQAGEQGRYTAGSMYQAWKGWSFADKKLPSPWLTYLVIRIQKRVGTAME